MEQNNSNRKSQGFNVGGYRAHVILIVMSLLMMVNYMDRQVLSAVLEPMKLDLNLTDTQAGTLQTAFLIFVALFSFPLAYLVDRWSRRKAAGIMAIIWSIFTFMTGRAQSFLGVLLPRIFVGVGEAAFQAGGTAWITAAYPEKSRSRIMGIFNAFIPLGSALGVILGGYLSVHHGGWRTPFYIFAIPGVILGIIAFFLKDYKTSEQATDEVGEKISFISSAISLFKIPTLKWLYIGYAMQNIMLFSFLAWAPAYLMRSQNLPADKAGIIIGIISLMGIISAPLGGIVVDKWQLKNPRARMLFPAIMLAMGTIFFILSMMMSFKGMGLVTGGLFGFFVMAGLPAMGSVSQDVVTPNFKGTAWGMNVFCMYFLGGGWAPVIVGIFSDSLGGGAIGLQRALLITSLGGLLGSFLFWIASKHYPTDAERVKHIILESEK